MDLQKQIIDLSQQKEYNKFHSNWFENNQLNPNTWFLECCLLQKWLREKHNIFVYVDYTGRPYIKNKDGKTLAEVNENSTYAGFKYEKGLELALFEALKLIK